MNLTGLLADGWFYISSAGLLVSGVLFLFLIGQYRAASDAADAPEAAAEPAAEPVKPVYVAPEPEPTPAATVASVSPPQSAAPPAARKSPENTTGGLSPAVVYLQNIKNQLETLREETRALSRRMDELSGRDEALIERLAEIARAVSAGKAVVPARAPEPSPSAAPAAEPSSAPAAAAAPESVAEAPAAIELQVPPAESAEAGDKPRRGPVWPV